MKKPKVSIIIPVYNAEKYLRRCLDSVLRQTFTDWECILIDDGSKDQSGKICDEYKEVDNRISVCHVANGGPSKARNKGLKIARGEWISFIDSDDWVKDTFLENLLSYSSNSDIVFTSFTVVTSNKVITPKTLDGHFMDETFYDAIINIYRMNVFGYTCLKLYKREIIEINNISFDEDIFYMEDCLFTWEFLSNSSAISSVNRNDYQYNMNEGSISLHIQDAEALYSVGQKINKVIERVSKKSKTNRLTLFCNELESQQTYLYICSAFSQNYPFGKCYGILKKRLIDGIQKDLLLSDNKCKKIYVELFTSHWCFIATCILKLLFGVRSLLGKVIKRDSQIDISAIWNQ